MKQISFLLTVLLVFGAFSAWAADGQEPAAVERELQLLRAENNMLKATLERRNKEMAALKEENAKLTKQVKQLQELSRNAGSAPPQPTTAPAARSSGTPKAGTYMYLGKPRDGAWFAGMYKQYADKIVRVNGKYLDVGEAIAIGPPGEAPWECKVISVIDEEQVLIHYPWRMEPIPAGQHRPVGVYPHPLAQGGTLEIFHITGVDTRGLVDGATFKAKLVCIGTYHYTTAMGEAATVPSCAVHTPLTKEQFAEALAGGLQLVSYQRVEQKEPGGGMEIKAVGRPVP